MMVILDDRLLIEELLAGLEVPGAEAGLATTSYWYYRACRAAVAGAGGHLSGPFAGLAREQQSREIQELLRLRPDVALPDHRDVVPMMARLALHHRHLNLLNLEALAAGVTLEAEVWLSSRAAGGVLPAALDTEGVAWRVVEIAPPAG